MKRSLVITILLSVIVGSCGDDTTATTATSVAATTTTMAATTTATATTVAPATTAGATTTIVSTTTGAVPSTTVYSIDPAAFFPAVFGADGDPHGSGCVVGADALPDGVWFGFATAVASGTIAFDLACFFTGDAAVAAAGADGEEAFDFYIRNQNPKLYSVSIATNAEVFYIDGVNIELTQIPVSDWPSAESYLGCPDQYCGVWLYLNGGTATGIVEQYLP